MLAECYDRTIALTGEEFEMRTAKELVPGCRFDRKLGHWWVPLTWASCQALRGVFGQNLEVGPGLLAWSTDHYELTVRPALEMHLAEDWKHPEFPARLYPFQRVGVAFLLTVGQVLLADEMGTGKTVQASAALAQRSDGMVAFLPALVVCPKSIVGTWKRTLAEWAPFLSVAAAVGSAKQRTEAIESRADVTIITWDSLRAHSRLERFGTTRLAKCAECDPHREDSVTASRCESHERELNRIEYATVIADEAHRAKDPKAKQTRALKAATGNAPNRWALTGTPLPNQPDELWSVMNWVSPEEFPSKTTFIDRYCQTGYVPYGSGQAVIGIEPATKDELFRFLDPHMLRRLKAQVLPWLPEKVYKTREVELAPRAMKSYKELAEESMTVLDEGGLLIGDTDLTLFTRLRQAANATLAINADGEVILTDPSAKLTELEDIINDLGTKPVVVFSDQRKLLELAEKRFTKLGISWVSIHGGVSGDDREEAEIAFQEGRVRVMFISLAGAEGLTLTAADTIVFLNRPLSLKDSAQAEDRIHRPGAEKHSSVTVVDIVAKGTIDEHIHETLVQKGERVEEVLRDRNRLAEWLGRQA